MSIPKRAKKVFKGKIFDVYQWKQKMFDGSHEIFEAIQRQGTVVMIPTVKDKIVVIRQKQPRTGWFYSTPSGRLAVPGETPKQAALRELLEETGMKPKKIKLWKVLNEGGKLQWNIYLFIAQDCQIVTTQKLDSGERIKVEYFSFDEFLKLSDHPTRHIDGTLIDMFKARLDKKYKKFLKKVIFG